MPSLPSVLKVAPAPILVPPDLGEIPKNAEGMHRGRKTRHGPALNAPGREPETGVRSGSTPLPRCAAWDMAAQQLAAGQGTKPSAISLEILVEVHRPLDADLVRRNGALEEVGQLLNVLQLHESERVLGAEAGR